MSTRPAAAQAHAETLNLVCTYETVRVPTSSGPYQGPDLHVSIDLSTSTVSGDAGTHHAAVSDALIEWDAAFADSNTPVRYSIDRISGKISKSGADAMGAWGMWGKCRRATQKF